ncbi:hypothetical protein C8J56DRAFT_279035 [Mycena floridula]|nr:hypothetical protein C8J56DRAFT_279035 [Mycena floridula]
MFITVLLYLVGFYLFLLLCYYGSRHYLLVTTTALLDLQFLQDSRPEGKKIQGNAVIAGGSIAGLLTAAICHKYFERVLIIEPEAWLNTEEGRVVKGWTQTTVRSRVMQYKSLQGCQAMLLRGLEKIFPMLHAECKASSIGILPADFKTTFAGAYMRVPLAHFKNVLPTSIFTSRQGLETLIRRLVFSGNYPTIEQITGTVIGVIPDPTNSTKISKVVVRTDAGNVEFDASLVVDCTGLTRAGLKWLERCGYAQPSPGSPKLALQDLRISYDQKLHYSSQIYTLTETLVDQIPFPGGLRNAGAVFTFLEDQPDKGRRFFVITKPDGPRLMLFAGQSGNGMEPRSLEEMRSYARDMVTFGDSKIPEWVWKTMDMLEEVEETMTQSQIRVPGTSYIRYQQATNLPGNYVAVGDSVMTVNPLFAQGCTKAMLGAIALNNILRTETKRHLSFNFSTRFFREQIAKIDGLCSRLLDYGIPVTEPIPGEDLSSGAPIRSYIRRLQMLAVKDDQAALVVFNSAHGLGTLIDAFHPWLVCKILFDMARYPNL